MTKAEEIALLTVQVQVETALDFLKAEGELVGPLLEDAKRTLARLLQPREPDRT